MAYNTKYGLKYPGGEDYYNVEDFNKNFSTVADNLDKVDSLAKGKADASHTHKAADISIGVLPVSRGGTGNNSVDNTPTSGSTKMVTSGGVYNDLTLKQSKYCYIIAAHDSDNDAKKRADLVCTGKSDDIKINAFINGIPKGSTIRFLNGYYNLSASIYIRKSLNIIGEGENTVFSATPPGLDQTTWIFEIGTGNGTVSGINIFNLQIYRGYGKLLNSSGEYDNVNGAGIIVDSDYPTVLVSSVLIMNSDNVKLSNILFNDPKDYSSESKTHYPYISLQMNQNTNIFIDKCLFRQKDDFNGYVLDNTPMKGENFSSIVSNCISSTGVKVNIKKKTALIKIDSSLLSKLYINGEEV